MHEGKASKTPFCNVAKFAIKCVKLIKEKSLLRTDPKKRIKSIIMW